VPRGVGLGPGRGGRRGAGVSLAAEDQPQRVLADLTVDECREFISIMANLAGSLWQIANPPPALATLCTSDPELAQACVDLTPRLRRTAMVLLAGLVPSRSQP
jgi:tetracycline repressor-like protein